MEGKRLLLSDRAQGSLYLVRCSAQRNELTLDIASPLVTSSNQLKDGSNI